MTSLRDSPSGPLVEFDDLSIESLEVVGNAESAPALPASVGVSAVLDFLRPSDLGWLFDGSANATVSAGNVLNKLRTDAFSISVWFRTRAPGATQFLVSKQGGTPNFPGYGLFLNSFGFTWKLNRIEAGGADTLSVQNVTTEIDFDLHNIVVTYNGSSAPAGVHGYYDAVEKVMSTINNTLTGNTSTAFSLAIGARPDDGNSPFNGQLAQVSIWSKALSQAEVNQVYNGGVFPDLRATTMAASLQWWIALDDEDELGPGGFTDLSTSGFDGTAGAGVERDQAQGSLLQFFNGAWGIKNADELFFPIFLGGINLSKFWFQASTVGNIASAFNVASVADTGTGIIDVSFSIPFTSSLYAVVGTIQSASTTVAQSITTTNQTAVGFRAISVVEGGSAADPVRWNMCGFGDLDSTSF
jgi:hypothetical protein